MEAGGIFLEDGIQNRRIELEERIEAESSKDVQRSNKEALRWELKYGWNLLFCLLKNNILHPSVGNFFPSPYSNAFHSSDGKIYILMWLHLHSWLK